MKRFRRTVLVTAVAGMLAMAAMTSGAFAAQTLEPASSVQPAAPSFQDAGEVGQDVMTAVVWSLVGIGIGALVMGVLYLLKRRVGGFPENPDWIAPIDLMPSAENPTEETFGMSSGHDDHGGHDAHGAHGSAQ